jgi:multidrug efflux pump subunit AcrA (membrane-fusion protein)
MSDRFKKRVLPLMVLAAGGLSAFLLASAREVPDRRPSRSEAPLVEAVEVSSVPTVVTVVGHGTVQPKTEIQLVPQVSGRVVEIHPQLAGGGRFEKGELLLAIDPVDFELAVQRAAA